MMNVAAYTKRDQMMYPGYVNVTHDGAGAVVVTLRGDPKTVDGLAVCGETVSLKLSVDEWAMILKDLAGVVQLPGVEQ